MQGGDRPVAPQCGTVGGAPIEVDRACFGHRVASSWPLEEVPVKERAIQAKRPCVRSDKGTAHPPAIGRSTVGSSGVWGKEKERKLRSWAGSRSGEVLSTGPEFECYQEILGL